MIRRRRYRPLMTAKGKVLDRIASICGIDRRQYWWIFKESDKKLRSRIVNLIRR